MNNTSIYTAKANGNWQFIRGMNKRSIYILLAIIIFIASYLGYFIPLLHQFTAEELTGIYAYNRDRIDSIYLFENMTYKHIHCTEDKKIFSQEGTWKIVHNYVAFDKFTFFTYHGSAATGNWNSRIEKAGGEIRLIYASDSGLYYKKTE
jgi:hypothetical protein